MEGFFPDKFLDDPFLDESLENHSGFLQYTEIPRNGSQQSFHVGSSSQNSMDEDEPAPAPADQSDFLQFLRVGFGQESSQTGLNSSQGAFVQHSDLLAPGMGSGQEKKDHGHGASPAANPSAFAQYRELPRIGHGRSNVINMRRRMIDFLKSCPAERTNTAEYERERGFRHMINERIRRQRQRQCCLDLHAMLPFGTKNDINSVIQMAAKEIQKLQACRDELKRQNEELEAKVLKGVKGNKVELRVAHPASPVDSVLETLQLLKSLGRNTRSITSDFSAQDLFALLDIDAKIEDAEVERGNEDAVNEENEWKLPSHDHEISKKATTMIIDIKSCKLHV